jgi:hypothetical protein
MRVALFGSMLLGAALAACSGSDPGDGSGGEPASDGGKQSPAADSGSKPPTNPGDDDTDAGNTNVPDAASHDTGSGNPPAVDAGDPNGGAICTSNKHWTDGNTGNAVMHPGAACIACHKQMNGPTFLIAGTVYPTSHEPTDCDGVKAVTINVTDAKGKKATIVSNAAGNFNFTGALTAPFKIVASANGRDRAMSGTAPTGDCNSCHTQDGANGAPGRILAP